MRIASCITACLATFAFAPVLCEAQGYVRGTIAKSAGGAGENAYSTIENQQMDLFGAGVLAVDASGNAYLAVRDGVFRVDAAGVATRVAGTEKQWRYGGDGGPALLARLNPRAVTIDAEGNLYLADSGNNRVRKVAAATGAITTVAGNGVRGFAGDGGPAASAALDGPSGLALDAAGNLYISDGTADGTDRIRKVEAATGAISTVAGNGAQGYSGDGGPATSAQFHSLGGLAADAAGNLYIADHFNNRIRMVSVATGIIATVAGSGLAGHAGDGGPATSAELNNPISVALDAAGNLYIADAGNFRIRRVTAATGQIVTLAGSGRGVYPDTQHGYPCALAVDAEGNLYVADSGASRIRRVPASIAGRAASEDEADATPTRPNVLVNSGFKINVTYSGTVPAAAENAFNSVVNTYQNIFTSVITVNINVRFGNTGLGASDTEEQEESYTAWKAAMIANAADNASNSANVAAAASLPANDPVGRGSVDVDTANARALGFTANTAVDSTLTFSDSPNTFEYTGVGVSGMYDFLDTAAHELDEALAIGSSLTGIGNFTPIPTNDFEPEDYFRYSASGARAITTNPNAFVYFSNNGGVTNVAQFNQDNNVGDLNDWIYGNSTCPAATPHVQDALICSGQAVQIGQTGSPELTVLNSMGYNSGASGTSPQPQTITFSPLGNVTLGVAPFSISATASSGLAVSFSSTTTTICTVSGSTVTIVGVGTCSITASQAGNASFSPAASVTQSFTVTNPSNPLGSQAGVFRDNFEWVLDASGNHQTGLLVYNNFVTPQVGDIPVAGDWNGSGTSKIGIYRPSSGTWFLDYNGDGVFDAGDKTYQFGGVGGDKPVVGDWSGSGFAKIGIFRSGFYWILDSNGNGVFDAGDQAFPYGGVAGDVPVTGDWTGDGKAKVGVVRPFFPGGVPAFWILDANNDHAIDGGDQIFGFGGIPGDVAVVGDWNGSGTSKAGVYRDGFFWVVDFNGSAAVVLGSSQLVSFGFGGIAGDVPVTGRWAAP